MAHFEFPLEKVLRWRSIQLAAEETRLKRLLQEQARLLTLRAELGAEKSRLLSSLGTLAGLRGEDLRAASAYSLRLKLHARKIADQLANCQKDLAARKKKYQEAQQRVRLLEELKERKWTDWRYNQDRQLEDLASESYLAAWNRDGL
jgi:flagellar export protein FliJ